MSVSDVHYVFICQGKSCLGKGSKELLSQIKTALAQHEAFKVVPFICFGSCTASPNIAVFPDRLWYSMVAPDRLESVVQSILRGEEIPELSDKVSNGLKDLVFRLVGKPFRA